jgi:outer membrane protein assembly factor BamE (lipoprotein component of BamABCDE complex)
VKKAPPTLLDQPPPAKAFVPPLYCPQVIQLGGDVAVNIRTIALAVALALTGCATASFTMGDQFDTVAVDMIEDGKTTTSDLLRWFGEPYTKSVVSDTDQKWIWTYSDMKTSATSFIVTTTSKTEGVRKTLDVLVRNGVVVNHAYMEKPVSDPGMNVQTFP